MGTRPKFNIKLVLVESQDRDRRWQALARVIEIIRDSFAPEQENPEAEQKNIPTNHAEELGQ